MGDRDLFIHIDGTWIQGASRIGDTDEVMEGIDSDHPAIKEIFRRAMARGFISEDGNATEPSRIRVGVWATLFTEDEED
jgi:hypothetical protein